MTQDEIIEMARQVGMDYLKYISEDSMKQVEAFAKLVAEHEREAIAVWLEKECDEQYLADRVRARGQA
jgi:hypothetical protein